MMFLTFIIGFIVALVIKAISRTADYYEFIYDHREGLKILKSRRSKHLEALKQIDKSINKIRDTNVDLDSEYFTGVSHSTSDYTLIDYQNESKRGSSKFTLLDYYYPPKENENENNQ